MPGRPTDLVMVRRSDVSAGNRGLSSEVGDADLMALKSYGAAVAGPWDGCRLRRSKRENMHALLWTVDGMQRSKWHSRLNLARFKCCNGSGSPPMHIGALIARRSGPIG